MGNRRRNSPEVWNIRKKKHLYGKKTAMKLSALLSFICMDLKLKIKILVSTFGSHTGSSKIAYLRYDLECGSVTKALVFT